MGVAMTATAYREVTRAPIEVAGAAADAERIRRIAQSVLSLPTLPTVVAKVVEMVQDPRTSAQDLARIISADQVLTARVLKLANSSYYGFPRKIGTINLAIVLLGYETVRDLVLSVSVIERFGQSEGDLWFDYSLFWEHSVATGIACRLFSRLFQFQVVGEAFVAGLIHDIGKLVLNQYLRKEFRQILRKANSENLLFYEAEEKVLGVSHGRIGAWMVERWNLPKTIVEALAFHHHPANAFRSSQLCHLVHFCDALVRRGGYGHSGDPCIPPLDPTTADVLGLKKTDAGRVDFEPYLDELHREMERAESLVAMVVKPREVPA
jgi:HD-like signal output (HDOD) protein